VGTQVKTLRPDRTHRGGQAAPGRPDAGRSQSRTGTPMISRPRLGQNVGQRW